MPKKSKKNQKVQIGALPPRHTFFLNPYEDVRFTTCPSCEKKTKMRKRPFLIHIDPHVLLTFNTTTRYCVDCDLIIMHQDILESYLVQIFEEKQPEIIGNSYLVIGTVERGALPKAGGAQKTPQEVIKHLHDFKDVVQYTVIPAHWGPSEE